MEKLKKKSSPVFDMKDVILELERDRKSGKLVKDIMVGKEWVEPSKEMPGYLVKISEDGTREIGDLIHGKFVVKHKLKK